MSKEGPYDEPYKSLDAIQPRGEGFSERGQAQTFSIFFNVEGDEDTYAADWNWQVPGWGVSCREYCGSRWNFLGGIKDKNLTEKVKQSAYLGLLEEFGISPDSLTPEKFAGASPQELAKLGTKDPESHTWGDHRKASEAK